MNELKKLLENAGLKEAYGDQDSDVYIPGHSDFKKKGPGFSLEIESDQVTIRSTQRSEPPGPAISMSMDDWDSLMKEFNQYLNAQHNY